ncbi:GxxExxY protein [Marispirochaeta aestuarii]|uniref:GxxExxY protein n=1 Tax=Marispirochaeta aestuarii TaxID=1963862 RepID=UPI002ABE1992|nr:GxxExxY protein [Marispirochaeta aestuarii]
MKVKNLNEINEITEQIIAACIEIHRELGPGLLESVYRDCLFHELGLRKMECKKEVPLSLEYKGLAIGNGYRIDLLVEDTVIVELKAVETVLGIHEAQILTYLRLARKKVGLLINFNTKLLKSGIKRYIL